MNDDNKLMNIINYMDYLLIIFVTNYDKLTIKTNCMDNLSIIYIFYEKLTNIIDYR